MQHIAIIDAGSATVLIRDVSSADEDIARELAEQAGMNWEDCEWIGGELTLDIRM